MNILVANENFTGGGLETHIHSYYMELREEHRFIFAVGKFQSDLEFRKEDIREGFHFGWNSSVGEFCEDVDCLVRLIREEKIDVIHVHPFFSLFPAVVASQLTGVPIVCTYHGIASFSFSNRINDTILFQYFYSELFSRIFTVSNTGKKVLMERMHIPDAVFLPNSVDMSLYKRHQVVNNRKWALISRLDADNGKESAIKKLFDVLTSVEMDAVDIYGDGTRRKELEQYAAQRGLNQVVFKGFKSDLYDRLNGHYNGVIGTDRVAVEGLTMGYPVLELGYGHLCGVFDNELLEQAVECNFDANILPDCGLEKLNRQLEKVYSDPSKFDFRARMVQSFDICNVAKAYVENLQGLPFFPHANVVEWFEALNRLSDQSENLYTSQNVFALMRQYIEYYAVNPDIKLLFVLGGECIDLRNAIAWVQNHGSETVKIQTSSTLIRIKRKIKGWIS